MTCVVAFVDKKKKLHFCADSSGTDVGQHTRLRLKKTKIFTVGEMLFGYTTSFRMGQLLENCFSLPTRPEGMTDDYQYMIRHVVPDIRKLFIDHGYMLSTDKMGGTFIIGYRGAIYLVEDDFAVLVPATNYAACGSGGSQAESILMTMQEFNLIDESDEVSITACLDKVIEMVSRVNITVHGRIDHLKSQ